jgi:5-methylcytosine-specific restriction endonuclease McrA
VTGQPDPWDIVEAVVAESHDNIWTRPLGTDTHGREPSDLYAPSEERAAELAAMPYRDYLLSPEWKERRRIEFGASQRRCQSCGSRGRLHIHHLTYERRGHELPEDLVVICERCHREEHGISA